MAIVEQGLIQQLLAPADARVDERPSAVLRRLLVLLDAGAALVAWLTAILFVQGPRFDGFADLNVQLLTAIALTALTVAAVAANRLYLSRFCAVRAVEIVRLGRAALGAGAAALLLDRFGIVALSTAEAVLGASLALALTMVARSGYRYWLNSRRRDGEFVRPLLVVGANAEALDLCNLIADHAELGYRVVGVVGDRDRDTVEFPVPHLGEADEAVAIAQRAEVSGVLFAASAIDHADLNELIREFLARGVHVHLSSGLRGIDHRRIRSQPMAHEPLFYVEPVRLEQWQLKTKRVLDLVGTLILGFLALPVLAAAAVAVKLQDGGPVIFQQQRVGRYGQPFRIYKFRTMVPNADAVYARYRAQNGGRTGPLIKIADDPRRTRVGRVLERLSVDELPQLWNVLRGDMSLVGPRPAQASEIEGFDEELLERLEVRPGLTGLWQVEARDNPAFSAYRRYDLFYLENWSVALDLAILLATVQQVLARALSVLTAGTSRDTLRPVPEPSAGASVRMPLSHLTADHARDAS